MILSLIPLIGNIAGIALIQRLKATFGIQVMVVMNVAKLVVTNQNHIGIQIMVVMLTTQKHKSVIIVTNL